MHRKLVNFRHLTANCRDHRLSIQVLQSGAPNFGGDRQAFLSVLCDSERRATGRLNCRMADLNGSLDILRIMILSADDDDIFHSPRDVELVGIQEGKITRAHKLLFTISEGRAAELARFSILAPIAARDVRTTQPDLAHQTFRQNSF